MLSYIKKFMHQNEKRYSILKNQKTIKQNYMGVHQKYYV